MLAFYRRVASYLKRIRIGLWIMLCGELIAFGWVVLNPISPEKNLVFLASVFLFGWTLCLLVIQAYFSQPIERPTPTDSMFLKWKRRLRKALSWGVALAVTGLVVTMILFTVRVFNVLTSNSGGG